jgi:hypothetical protein
MARCEYDPSVADAAWKNILFLTDGPSPMDPRLQHVWQATLLREIRTFARASLPAQQPWTEEELAKAIRPELDDLATDVTEDFFMTVAESIARVALSRPLAKVDVEDVRLVAEYRMPGTDAVFDIDDVTAAAYRILAAIWEGKP